MTHRRDQELRVMIKQENVCKNYSHELPCEISKNVLINRKLPAALFLLLSPLLLHELYH